MYNIMNECNVWKSCYYYQMCVICCEFPVPEIKRQGNDELWAFMNCFESEQSSPILIFLIFNEELQLRNIQPVSFYEEIWFGEIHPWAFLKSFDLKISKFELLWKASIWKKSSPVLLWKASIWSSPPLNFFRKLRF